MREIENIDVVGLDRNQSSLPPGFVTLTSSIIASNYMTIHVSACDYTEMCIIYMWCPTKFNINVVLHWEMSHRYVQHLCWPRFRYWCIYAQISLHPRGVITYWSKLIRFIIHSIYSRVSMPGLYANESAFRTLVLISPKDNTPGIPGAM